MSAFNFKKCQSGVELASTPSFFRRCAAMLYDSFLLLAVWFFASALLLPFNQGHAPQSGQIFHTLYLIVVSFGFYGWFWTHGGQTLGLRAWKLKVLTTTRQPLTWRQAALRFFSAILSWAVFGLGFLWILGDKKRYAWHDYLSKTAVFFDERI